LEGSKRGGLDGFSEHEFEKSPGGSIEEKKGERKENKGFWGRRKQTESNPQFLHCCSILLVFIYFGEEQLEPKLLAPV
jgi:hypothetical protein